jgi:TonB family protein
MNEEDYPLLSIAQNEQGNVLVDFQVNRDGSVADVKIANSSGFARLDGAAADAARQRWHFDPVLVDGKPVSCRARVAVKWMLNWSVEQFVKIGFTIVHMGASDYPSGSLARGERGASVIQVAVYPTGKILDANASQSSGFADLDAAAIEAAKSGRWAVVPAQVSSKPVSTMVGFVVIWSPSGK